jgi:putative transposase
MPNHFHLLVRVKGEKGLSEFLKKTLTGYSMYFNKKYKRTGSLFEGAFKAQHVDSDEYLKYLFAYIHLNPIKLFEGSWKESGIQDRYSAKKFLANYQLSSYLDFLRIQRPEKKILSTASFPDYFNNDVGSFDTYIKFWLDFTPHLVKVSP